MRLKARALLLFARLSQELEQDAGGSRQEPNQTRPDPLLPLCPAERYCRAGRSRLGSSLSPEPARCCEGNFPSEQPCSPQDGLEQGALRVTPWRLGKPPFPRATRGDFIPKTLFSPLIQTAFRKRKHFSAPITSPESGYCLISSFCHLNTASHGGRAGQGGFVPGAAGSAAACPHSAR